MSEAIVRRGIMAVLLLGLVVVGGGWLVTAQPQTGQTAPSARTMALDPATHRIYTVAAKFGTPAAGQRRPPVLPGTFEMLVLDR